MSAKHRPPTWWKDREAECDAYDAATACVHRTHRMLVWRDDAPEPACSDCGHRITAHTAVAYVNDTPCDPLMWCCGERDCSCETTTLTWDEP